MFVAYALLPPAEVGLIGSYLQSTFRAEFDVNIPWWMIGLVPAGADGLPRLRGHPQSACEPRWSCSPSRSRSSCCWRSSSSARAARTGSRLHPLNPANSPHGFSGLTTGFVFAALSFVGFEAAATLGDETKEPRKIVPRAVLLSVLAVGGLYVFCVWAEVIGLGADEGQLARRLARPRGTTSPPPTRAG